MNKALEKGLKQKPATNQEWISPTDFIKEEKNIGNSIKETKD